MSKQLESQVYDLQTELRDHMATKRKWVAYNKRVKSEEIKQWSRAEKLQSQKTQLVTDNTEPKSQVSNLETTILNADEGNTEETKSPEDWGMLQSQVYLLQAENAKLKNAAHEWKAREKHLLAEKDAAVQELKAEVERLFSAGKEVYSELEALKSAQETRTMVEIAGIISEMGAKTQDLGAREEEIKVLKQGWAEQVTSLKEELDQGKKGTEELESKFTFKEIEAHNQAKAVKLRGRLPEGSSLKSRAMSSASEIYAISCTSVSTQWKGSRKTSRRQQATSTDSNVSSTMKCGRRLWVWPSGNGRHIKRISI